jgi:hypothetical protein
MISLVIRTVEFMTINTKGLTTSDDDNRNNNMNFNLKSRHGNICAPSILGMAFPDIATSESTLAAWDNTA